MGRQEVEEIVGVERSMPKPVPLPPPGLDSLSIEEKIDYLRSLRDRVAASPETRPVPDWPREILDERLKDLERRYQPGNLLIGGPETDHVPVWVGDR